MPHRLFAIVLTLLSLLAATGAAPAHTLGMAATGQEMATMPHASGAVSACEAMQDCRDAQGCNADSGLCFLVCAGLKTWLVQEPVAQAPILLAASWMPSKVPGLDGIDPERTDRPPDEGLSEV
ncbi:MAG: hypothetical protein CL949_22745 [Erythrobacter sp.]|nr:hypothetical protein [Erythrobacter sp.]